jgi:2-hydroxychromene-2-carboxylate isomerase
VFRANFENDLDISSPEVIEDCLSELADDPAGILDLSQTDDSKSMLRAQTDEAIRLGIFGAPSFVFGGELFWGNDRLESALSWEGHGAQEGSS